MALIEWKQDFSVKIKKFDNQHKVLFDIINALYDLIENASDKEELVKLIDNLRLYAERHFAAEERFFDKFDYPESEAHKKEHRMFEQRVMDYKNSVLNDEELDISEILEFLVDWLVIHIKKTDKQYSAFLNSKGVF